MESHMPPRPMHTDVLDADLKEESFELDEFLPKIFDCEADGCCNNGHQHTNTKT